MSDYRTLKLALLADTSKFSSGLNNATKQTQSFGDKVKANALKIGKAFAVAGGAVAAMATKLAIDGVKAAIEDQKAQVKLATTLKNTTKASNSQIKSVEKYIDKLQRASGVSDEKLRPSLEKLLVATGKVGKAQKLQALAMDIAAGTGKDLDTVSLALAKAYNGNLGSLTRLGIKLDDSIIKNKDFNAAAKELNKTFTGQSAAAAETMEGKFKRFNIAIDEAKESIGVALMPTIEKMVNYLNSPKGQKVITDFAEAFADAIKMIAKYLPGIVQKVGQFVSKVSKQGLVAGLMSDPRIAVAATAYGAGFIAGGPAGGAVAALAAYAMTEGIEGGAGNLNQQANRSIMEGMLQGLPKGMKSDLLEAKDIGAMGARARTQAAMGVFGSNSGAGWKAVGQIRDITINFNGQTDPRKAAREIERVLKKINLNGGSLAGLEGFN